MRRALPTFLLCASTVLAQEPPAPAAAPAAGAAPVRLTVDEAVARAQAYAAAGADMFQPIDKTFSKEADLRRLRDSVPIPLSIPINVGIEKLPPSVLSEVASLALFPLVPLLTVCEALRANLAALARDHSTQALPRPRMELGEFKSVIGFPRIEALQAKYLQQGMRLKAAE